MGNQWDKGYFIKILIFKRSCKHLSCIKREFNNISLYAFLLLMPIVLLLNRGLISKSTYSNNVKLAKGNQQYENNQKKNHILLQWKIGWILTFYLIN